MDFTQAPVHTLGRSLKKRYGRRLRRVMLDLGLTCPNRDGVSGYGGCIYCDLSGSGTGAAKRSEGLIEQWQTGLQRARKVNPEGQAAIIYFQSYSNTYPDLQPLAEALEQMKEWASVAPILAVGTRPDCFSEEAADLLTEQTQYFDEVWVEFGLETADDKVQEIIGRHDTLANFHIACARAGKRGLHRIAHCIAGLPGEKEDGLLRQVEEISKAQCEGIKFHQMMVLHKTKLAKMWMDGAIDLLNAEQYTNMVADAVEMLPPNIIIHRLVAEAPEDSYLAPKPWPGRAKVHTCIEQELLRRGSHQGSRLA